ncbi:MAG TPA: hypothetical protein VIF62_06670 [Labilithrix sp.]
MKRVWALAATIALAGCEAPYLAKDGTLAFPERGAHGASVLTANGIEYRDRGDVPTPINRRSADEPWRAPIGFILPRDGRFTETSKPTVLATTGLAIVLRPSDTRVPAWGGEVLVRVDVIAPAAEGTARWGENVAIVLAGDGADGPELLDEALAQLAGRDRVAIVDAHGARTIVPLMPASHRSMANAAVRNHLRTHARPPKDIPGAVRAAQASLATSDVTQRLLVLTDQPLEPSDMTAVAALAQRGVQVATVSTTGTEDDLDLRRDAVRRAIPAAGFITFRDVRLTFEGTPAPSHVLEVSGGEARWHLDAGELVLGNVHAGEARTEMLRVSVPPWLPNESFEFTVSAHVDDLAWGGPREFSAKLPCTYDDDIERIAKSRHGDVIAYASAMATLRRLDAAFVGDGVERSGGLRRLAEVHARSMQLLARDSKDFAVQEQADLLGALLRATQ